ncbi:non-ribosomal peptide synthase/polyketide synthase [Pseudomonas syringae]|uniref:non-ribosomal peptide synthetase n=7 Tax=Pseudomonas syringae TaxID=317 RepID=UPI003F68A5DA
MFDNECQDFELTSPQQGIWFDQIANPELPYYNIGMILEIKGELDVPLFEKAFQLVVDRHDSLRLVLSVQGGNVRQRVLPYVKSQLSVVEFSGEQASEQHVKAYLHDVFRQPFNLVGEVLWEARLVRCGPNRYYCLHRYHHLICDGITVNLLLQAVADAYNGLLRDDQNPPQGNAYLSFIAEDQAYTESPRFERDKAFWTELYAELPPPLLQPRVAVADNRVAPSALSQMKIPRRLFNELAQFARGKNLSLAHIFISIISTYFCRTTGVDSIVIGMPVHNRTTAYQKNTAGMFSSLSPVRLDVDPEASFLQLMQATSASLRRSYRHQRFPIAELNRVLKLSQAGRRQLFDLSLSFESLDGNAVFGNSPTEIFREYSGYERLPLAISTCDYHPDKDVYLDFNFNTAFFTREEVQKIQTRILSMLTHVIEWQDTAVWHFPIMPKAEQQQLLLTFNAAEHLYPQDELIHTRFERQAERQPDACAVSDHTGKVLTYAELNREANQLAHHLIEKGIGLDDRVAICVERGPQMIIGLLGILKAGAGYVPLDPAYPAERLAYLLQDSSPAAVLVQAATADVLPLGSLPVINLDDTALQTQSVQNPHVPGLNASHLAYVIYTSGSTGLPKGVQVEHRNVARLFSATDAWFGFNANDVWALFHSFAFDFSVWEIWGALVHGAQLLIVPQLVSRSPQECYALLCDAGVTVLNQTPSAFRQLIAAQGENQQSHSLRQVIFGGEALDTTMLKPWYARPTNAGTQLVNMYGITETTVHVTYYPLLAADAERTGVSPIGRRIPDLQLYVLDAQREPVPLGVPGELYVGGAGVARGYLNRPELNEQRFLANPFSEQPGARLYRTGDLVRWLDDGNLEYLGRNDDQVKIRGLRIELGEIEAKLAAHEAVRDALAMAREDIPGDQRLVAYFIGDSEVSLDVLHDYLLAQLPDYMVPTAYVQLEKLPLTSNGKLDRNALPAPDQSSVVSREYQAPQGAKERAIAEIWQDLLGLDQVGRHDHFFELGGHSLLAVKLIERMRQIGLSADVRVLFSQPTLAALAAAVGGGTEVVVPANLIPEDCEHITPDMLPLVDLTQASIDQIVARVPGGAANVQDIYALAPLQEGILYHHLSAERGDPYVLKSVFAFQDQARLDAFSQALQQLIQRHDILRTSLFWEGLDESVQVVWRQASLGMETLDLDPAQGDISTQLQDRYDPRHYRLELGQAPLMRLVSAYDAPQKRIVSLLLCHHLVLDHTALDVMRDEIQALMRGEGHELPASAPYRNYVAQARLGVSLESHEAFFRDLLGDIDEPTLPFNLHDVQGDGSLIEEVHHRIDYTLSQRLRKQARQAGVSAASLVHLAWAQVLSKVTGKDTVVFGTVLMGRMSGSAGTDRALGMFINTLPMRIDVGHRGAQVSVKATHAQLSALLKHEHASLALAQRCSGVPGDLPLFSALLNYRHSGSEALSPEADAAWAGIQMLSGQERTNYPLTLNVDDLGEGFILNAQTVVDIGAQRVCNYMQAALQSLVEALEHAPQAPLHSLSILPEQERHQLIVEFNATALDYPLEQTIHGLFEAQVERTPQAVAVVHGDVRLSYRELNNRANQLAHHLRDIGVKPDSRVAICVERSESMVIGLLAILKAGGGYVPLDPTYPADRIAYMLQDSAPTAVLAQRTTLGLLTDVSVPLINLDDTALQAQSVQNPHVPDLTPAHLAYVIYTSGSTGLPKGVMIEHRNTVNFLTWAHQSFDSTVLAKTLFSTSLNFDLAVYECFAPLTSGGSVDVVTNVLAMQQGDHDVTLINTVPSALKALLESGGLSESVHTVNVAGEALKRSLVESLFQQTHVKRLCNLYGPSETTTYSSWVSMDREQGFASHIGKPVGNTQFYLLDKQMQPVPLGVPGEIYIGGAGVARGYLNRDDLTAERFLRDPFSKDPNARMYKTGDLGRWLADGNIEYLGRNDDQVKIRGFRIELGEIEACLAKHESVKEAVVMARDDVPGDKRLVAYFTADSEVSLDILREYLLGQLPDYMVPTAYVQLEKLPLTPNGKLDRKALPAPDQSSVISHGYEAPVGGIEIAIADLWQDLLGIDQVGRNDHFFELGGHSLLAVKLIERMRQIGLSADVRVLFSQPTLAALAAAVDGGTQVVVPANLIPEHCKHITPDMLPLVDLNQASIDQIVARVPGGGTNVQDIYPLAPLQEGILYHHLMAPEDDPYRRTALFNFDSQQRVQKFAEALQAVIDRHDILRTSVLWEDLDEPVQVVWRHAELSVEEIRIDPAAPNITAQLQEVLDPHHHHLDIREAPMMRIAYAHDPVNNRWAALLVFHHLINDATSLPVLAHEIEACMQGQEHLLPASVPYRNYVAQARLGVSLEAHEAFFCDLLGDIDEPTLPFDLHDVQGDGSVIEEVQHRIDDTLSQRLRKQARLCGVSTASLYHMAWAQVLGKVTGKDEVVFGTVLMGRMQGGDGADRSLGMFINTLPLRVELGNQGVRNGVKQTHAHLTALLGHEHASLVLAQRCSGVPAPTPLFSALLNYRHTDVTSSAAEGLGNWIDIERLKGTERTNYPLALNVDDEGLGFTFTLTCPIDIGAERIAGYVQTALESLVEALEHAPQAPLNSLSILPEQERNQLIVDFNATTLDYPLEQTIHGLFEAQVERTPQAVAVVHGDLRLSYRELNNRANQLAHQLIELGIGPDNRVAICVERSEPMIVGLLATLKAGAGYVPLDPAYPAERLAYLLQDSSPAAVLVQAVTADVLSLGSLLVINLDDTALQMQSVQNPHVPGLTPAHLAYVIYTSGSTGMPKGVQVEHRNVARLFSATDAWFDFNANDVWALFHSFAFDFSVWEIWGALVHGAQLLIVPQLVSRSPQECYALLCDAGVTVLSQTPSAFRQLIAAQGESQQSHSLRQVIFGGEALDTAMLKPWYARQANAGTQLVNMYGITETTVHVTYYPLLAADAERTGVSPIGRRIPDLQLYVLDAQREPVPLGVPGELYVGGAGVARGYLNRPELNEQRFLINPFSEQPGARLYRTGDLVRWLADGSLEYLGRNDDQVKIRGFRIELGEIEALLAKHESVKDAVIIAREDVPGDKRLVAYYTSPVSDETQNIETLRTHLQAQLPDYMVPAAYVRLESLPLTPNGKLDRKALPAPDLSSVISREYQAPQGATERAIAEIWQDLLGIDQVGRHDHFFELGGHSLLAVKLIERMRQVGLSADVRVLFTQPTLAALAAAVGGGTEIVVPTNLIPEECEHITPNMLPLVDLNQASIDQIVAHVPGGVANVQDIYALAPLQEGIFYHHLMASENDPYRRTVLFNFDSQIRVQQFAVALQTVIARHDILRTSVRWEDLDEPVQVVWRHAEMSVQEIRIDSEATDPAAQLQEALDPRHHPLDIRQAPMMRIAYAHDSVNDRWAALLVFHHLINDATSLPVLAHEIEACMQGQEHLLPVSVPYRNYVAQARLGVSLEAHEAFFRNLLGDIDEPTLPFDLRDVQGDGSELEEVRQEVEPDLARRLRQQAQSLGVSAASLYHLAWAQVLGKVTGKDEVVFGTVLMGRMQGGDGADRSLGMFINTLPLRVELGNQGVRNGVKQTHARLTALLGHEHASLVLAQRCSGVPTPTPLFSALLNYRHSDASSNAKGLGAWLDIERLKGTERTNYPLALSVDDQGQGFALTLTCPIDIGAERIAGYVQTALESLVNALADAPSSPLNTLPILPQDELQTLLVDFNATALDYPLEQTIHGLFEVQVERTPQAVALVHGDLRLSYRELNNRANKLAHQLIELGIGPDDRVAICVERGPQMIVGLLAILKAGAGYVPLDPAYPAERLAYMLLDSTPAAVLVQAATADVLTLGSLPVINLDDVALQAQSVQNPHVPGLTPAHLAYVIYTSGSTGLPKGVQVEHRNVVNLVQWGSLLCPTAQHGALLHKTSISFDASVWEIFWPLCSGLPLVLARPDGQHDPAYLARLIRERQVSVVQFVPVLLQQFLDLPDSSQCLSLTDIVCGGGELTVALARQVRQRLPWARLHNVYGPTETTVDCSSWTLEPHMPVPEATLPIGRPIGNTRLYVLDTHDQRVPLGVIGQLHIGGAGVTRGYLNLPHQQAERFIDSPFVNGDRLYRSGDLVRQQADGNIEYLGRNDDQVKLRGFRIELGEIESQLSECPGVREAVVLVREHRPGDKRLVAYLTAREGAVLSAPQLREQLSQRLAEYMIPSAFVTLARFPLTPNGKLDRRALPEPEDDAYASRGYEPPVGEIEHALADIWQALLGLDRVGRHDHFFELGGHSLLAVQLVSRLRQRFEVEVALRDVFAEPTLQGQARQVASARLTAQTPLTPVDRDLPLPLSWAQQRLWFLDQLDRAAGAAYHIPAGLRLRGRLDSEALQATLDRIVARHETLRTHFALHEGQAIQVIAPATQGFALATHDLRALDSAAQHETQHEAVERLAREEAVAPFDLSSGPLVRGRLVQLSETEHILLVTQHHIVSDGWSTGVLLQEIGTLYRAFSQGLADPLPALAFQYVDYAAWQRQWLQGENLHTQVDFWRQHLSGAPALLELPSDHRRPPLRSYAGGRVSLALSPALTAGLRQLGQRHGATLFMTLLVGWSSLLSRFSGQDDVVIGTPVANRPRSELESLIGFFVNTLALRIRPEGSLSVTALLEQVKAIMLAAHAHQDLPFEQVVEALQPPRSLAHSPIFQVMLALNNTPGGSELSLPELSLEPLQAPHTTAQFDLSLSLVEADGGLMGSLEYASDLFERATIERMAGHLQVLLEGMVADDQQSVGELPLLSCEQRRQVLESFNDTAVAYPADKLLHQLFEEQVARRPDALAVADETGSLTYGELNARANRLAHYLIGLGVQPDDRVAICAQRSLEMVVGLLGILKAGGAYVPLDPGYPSERLHYMLEDSTPVTVLVQGETRTLLGELAVPTLDLQGDDWEVEAEHNPVVPAITPQHLVYVIYTSGSTGKPKGVANQHDGVVNRLWWAQSEYRIGADDRVLQKTPFGFDVSVWEIFLPLLAGAQLVMARAGGHQDPHYLMEVIERRSISMLHFVPSMLQAFVNQTPAGRCSTLKRVLCSGEALPHALQLQGQAHFPKSELHNLYGPTEAAIDVTAWHYVAEQDIGIVPIGRPIANTQIYLLDAHGQPVPIGVSGEIHIGGIGVARGYLNRPELTAERFLEDPFSAEPAARMYRSGDLGRWLADGNIEYLGRNDDQVKLRGYRIELGEIESQLAGCHGVREAVVLAREHRPGDKRLVAYLTAQEGAVLSAAQLREQLSQGLAEYMIPSAFVKLARFPLTPNGKLDRRALPAPEDDAYASRGYEAPVGEIEHALAEIWQALLGLERVGRHDHFFELGGHSLLAVSLIERMRQIGLRADVRVLFSQPTLMALAAAAGGTGVVVPANLIEPGCLKITPDMLPLTDLTQDAIDHIVATVQGGVANVQDIYPLAPLQEGILYHHLMAAEGDPYLQYALFGFDSLERAQHFTAALQTVIARHDILRTSVLWEGLDEPVQVVWRKARLTLDTVLLESADGDIASRLYERFDPRQHRLDIRQAPLIHMVCAQDPDNERWVAMLRFHHLIDDVTSLAVISREVEACMLGQEHHLPASVPYRNYVAQARLGVSIEAHEAFFRDLLGDIDEPTLPFDLHDVQGDGSGVKEAHLPLDSSLSKRLRVQARQLGVSAACLHHLAWAQVLSRISGKDDVVFGTVLMGRMNSGEGADRALGMFINTLPMRINVGHQGAQASVQATHAQLSALLEHEHASLALAQRCSGVAAPAPLFSALLNYRHGAAGTASAEALYAWHGIEVLGGEERTNYPLTLNVDDLGDGFKLTALVAGQADAQRVCAYMQAALESLVEALEHAPQALLHSLSILPEQERHQLIVEFNATALDYPLEQTIHGLFEAQVERTPQAVAVVHGDVRLSYRELNNRANQLAHHLRDIGVKPDSRVAICVERSESMVIGLLAILKAGGGYVPLDPAYPADRIAYMLQDSAPTAVLAQRTTLGLLTDVSVPLINLDDTALQAQSVQNPHVPDLTPAHLAYVIYTSGSTGLPKGVMIEHRNTVNFLTWAHQSFDSTVLAKTLFSTSLNFDLAVYECFAPLTSGGSVDVVTNVLALQHGDHDVTLINTVPSALKALLESGGLSESVHTVNVAGEALKRSLVESLFQQTHVKRLCNLYGPSETTTYSSWVSMDREQGFASHIGKPVGNTQFYLLDKQMQPVPLGVPGEIYIGGAGVARGYLNRDDLTAERFLRDPFSKDPNARMYKTGDLGRWLADGNIEYLGRNDDQVKIRGFRIELGEIEACLAKHESVKEAVVMARDDVPGDKRLVAYFTADSEVSLDVLREHLLNQLPDYMVPAAYVSLESLPLTPNGKLDRKALPAPDQQALVSREYQAPQGVAERTIADIWQDLLGIDQVSRHDHFFELGGHSLLAVKLIERMRQQNMSADVRVLFSQPTLAALAAAVGGGMEIVVPANLIPEHCERITPDMLPLVDLTQDAIDRIVAQVPGGVGNVQDVYPLAPLQEGILYHHLMAPRMIHTGERYCSTLTARNACISSLRPCRR